MLEFPFYGSFIGQILTAIFAVLLIIWSLYGYSQKDFEDSLMKKLRLVLGTFAGLVILALAIFQAYAEFAKTHAFRSIEISKIKAVNVRIAPDESLSVYLQNHTIDNSPKMQEAFKSLRDCAVTSRQNREKFTDGYHLKLILGDGSKEDFQFTVYRKSSVGTDKNIVIPVHSETAAVNSALYHCSEFHDWLKQEVDPLFQNP